jgi:hypothetical protein
MVVGVTTTYSISAYYHWCCEFESRSWRGSVTCDRWLISPGPPVSSSNKTDRHDIAEILLKVVLNTNKQTNKRPWPFQERCSLSYVNVGISLTCRRTFCEIHTEHKDISTYYRVNTFYKSVSVTRRALERRHILLYKTIGIH